MIKTVAIYEFLSTVKRKAYYLVTLGMPVILLAYFGLIGLIAYASVPSQLKKLDQAIGIVDESGILVGAGGKLSDLALGEIHELKIRPEDLEDFKDFAPLQLDKIDIPIFTRRLRRFDDLQTAQDALLADELSSVLHIPADYLETGRVDQYVHERNLIGSSGGIGFLGDLLSEDLLRQSNLPEASIARVRQPPRITEYEFDEEAGFIEVDLWRKGFEIGIPMGVAGLLVIALMMNSSLLLASVAEEKESKVMEVILSSVSAEQLLFGKVLGLVAAGLLQIVIWMLMVSVVPILITLVVKHEIDYDIREGQLLLGVLFMVLGFVFYGCLLAGLGSMGSTYKDCQQLTVVIIMCACVPMMAWMTFLNDPNGPVARTLSMIPLFAPISMMLRLGLADVPWWEPALSLVILLLSIWGAVKLSAKLFRVGTLMYGKRPGLREIFKVLRQPT